MSGDEAPARAPAEPVTRSSPVTGAGADNGRQRTGLAPRAYRTHRRGLAHHLWLLRVSDPAADAPGSAPSGVEVTSRIGG
ncbi:hypothetical protein [Streptomyces sp. LMG1-1-1.1]|uniref:hypothetical protein n=1 Tax=Streptomyces sp. LMG1-1-1.1 TaxID=3135245 RepID=UPI0034657ED2